MKLELDAGAGRYHIRAYSADAIVVNDQVVRHSCIIMPDRLVTDWPPQRFIDLTAEHLMVIAHLAPELVLLGSGRNTRFPKLAVLAPLIAQSIGYEVMDTAAACRCYTVLAAQGRRVAAALLPPNAD